MTDFRAQAPALRQSSESPARTTSGYGMLLVLLVALGAAGAALSQIDRLADGIVIGWLVLAIVAVLFVLIASTCSSPIRAFVVTLFGDYRGTDRTAGLRWTWPWRARRRCRCAPTTSSRTRSRSTICAAIRSRWRRRCVARHRYRAGAVRRRRLQGVRDGPTVIARHASCQPW
ncbi:MAG: hypothetical protein WDN44_05605 [Sphingomonas sp.]